MTRPPRPEELRLWGLVTSTVRAKPQVRRAPRRTAATVVDPDAPPVTTLAPMAPLLIDPNKDVLARPKRAKPPPETIEPNRRRRIVREHDRLEARLDMHGLDQDRAQAALENFLRRAWEDGYRAALVITGKGRIGGGVLRSRTPEWLAGPALRDIVAGVSQADKRHGGEGALYVALKRRT